MIKAIQRRLGVTADGIAGPKTLAVIVEALQYKGMMKGENVCTWPAVQRAVGVTPDGVAGPKTFAAIAGKLDIHLPTMWPSQAEVRSNKSIFGFSGDESNLVNVSLPYPMFYEGKKLSTIRVHRLVANAVKDALTMVFRYYGAERIHELGLDVYGGSYNNRSTSTGKAKSMHAWGIALDFDPERNDYSTKKPKATLSRAECDIWWEIWESVGAVSLGRECNYDWMHVQFATL
ncbi:M15 family metallopeptidase [Akkermansia glycaniphila]|nr:M15 family metallopeptidase [Akkermansia glycaniphila]